VWTTLSGDGRIGTFYVRTGEEKLSQLNIFSGEDDGYVSYIPVLTNSNSKKNISPGERGTLAYLRYMIYEARFIESGDVIIIDAESALCTEIVQQYLSAHQIYPFILPSALHQLLNPCDNSFHSIFKHRYYKIISSINESVGVKEKLNLARQCFHDISKETVAKMFQRCGLISTDQTKRSVVTGLMCEGMTCLHKHNQYHKVCLLSFLQWCKRNNLCDTLCPFRFNISDIL